MRAPVFLMPRGGEDDVWAADEIRSGAFVGRFSLRGVGEGVGELGIGFVATPGVGAWPPRGNRAGRDGVRGQGFRTNCRYDHGGQSPLASSAGKDGLDPGADRPSRLARSSSRKRTGGGRVNEGVGSSDFVEAVHSPSVDGRPSGHPLDRLAALIERGYS
jgi:hypothetical protein